MKKGIVRIIAGVPLVILQLMSFAGNAKAGNGIRLSFTTPALFMYDLVTLISYCFVGIVGMALLVSGLIAYFKPVTDQDTPVESEEEDELTTPFPKALAIGIAVIVVIFLLIYIL